MEKNKDKIKEKNVEDRLVGEMHAARIVCSVKRAGGKETYLFLYCALLQAVQRIDRWIFPSSRKLINAHVMHK